VAAVQYTFTHKQYTGQHNETEYPEQNRTYITIRIHKHNNKHTQFTKLNRSIKTYNLIYKYPYILHIQGDSGGICNTLGNDICVILSKKVNMNMGSILNY
jgi:hypothetical protein